MLRILHSPLVALCLVVVGAFLMYTGHMNAVKFAALRDHGKTAKAEITKLEWKEKKITQADGQYTAHIRFNTEDGREIQADVRVPSALGHALRGDATSKSMTVRYLPESPYNIEDVTTDDTSDAQQDIGRYLLFAGLAMLALGYFLSRSQSRPRSRSRSR